MSVSSLGGILRRLRRDIAERATFRNGTVVEMIDATHVLVDIGKPVPAFCSPIFLPAVVVGTPVTVRIQGSHYDVVDAPQSPARLVTTAELADIMARLTALEPGNLLDNPVPAIDFTFYNTTIVPPYPYIPLADVGWSTYPDAPATRGGSANWDMVDVAPGGLLGKSFFDVELESSQSNSSTGSSGWLDAEHPSSRPIRCFPLVAIDAVTGQKYVTVTPGRTYSVSCETAYYGPTLSAAAVRMGITWFDSSMAELSTSYGDSHTYTDGEGVDWQYFDSETVYETYYTTTYLSTASLLAPAGATFARCFVEFVSNGWDFMACWFDMRQA